MATLRDLQDQLFNRVNPLVGFSVRRYVLAVGFFVAVVAFGLVATLRLGVDLLPSVSIPIVSIQTNWSGATPSVIDEQITQVVESAVSTLAGITDISANSSSGSSRVTLSLDSSVNKDAAINQIASRISAIARRLPTGVNPPTVQSFDPNSQPILQFGVSAPGVPMEDLGDWVANDFAPLLERVQGVANVQVDGVPSRQYQVILDPNLLQYYKLNPQQISSAISSSAVNQPIGSITANNNTVTFTTKNQPKGVDSIANVLVDGARGLTVSDLAKVRQIPVPSAFIRVNGQPSILVSIQKSTDGNSVAVAQAVREFLAKAALPTGYAVKISNDTTGPITASIENTYHELFLTGLVVALICLLFLGKLNTAFSVILAIPIALAASPILYTLLGFTFNLVSLLAMIVAIGIVVDDSIVVAENVVRYRQMGYDLKEAVLKGASEVFSAVVAASLSLLSVLLPVSFIGGTIGQYVMQFSLGLAAAVFFSLVEAVLFLTVRLAYTPDTHTFTFRDFLDSWLRLPQALKWGLKAWKSGFSILVVLAVATGLALTGRPWWIAGLILWPLLLGLGWYVVRIVLSGFQALTTFLHGGTEAVVDWVREGYARSMGGVLKFAVWILIGAGVFFVGTLVFIGPKIPFNFVPQSDAGTLNASVRLPQGTPASLSNEAAGRLESWLLARPEVLTVQTQVNSGGASGIAGNANMTIQLVPVEERRSSAILATEFRRALTPLVADLPSARVNVNAGGFGGGGFGGQGTSVSLTLLASDFDALTAVNDRAIDALQQNPLVADVTSSLSNTTLENVFIPDPEKLKGTGLAPNTVAQVLQTYASGAQAGNVQTGGKSYPIQVLLDPSRLKGTQSLLDLPIYAPSLQTNLPAGQLGRFVLTPAPSNLQRTNRQYSATLNISLNAGGPPVSVFQKQVVEELTAQGILGQKVSVGGESRNSFSGLTGQLATQAPIAFLMSVFLAYLVMGAQFNSWRYPIYLLLPVPLALVGALWFVFLTGTGLDIFGVLGMLLLIGLSAKNAILYLDFVVERIEVMPLADALVEAARLRFRPIVMTTLTVLVISFPLIFSAGQGSEFGQKLGVVMLGGVLSSAILTFFVVPAAFWLFERSRHQEKALGLLDRDTVMVESKERNATLE